MKKIGVLIPNSKAYPKISKEFINGLKLSIDKNVDLKVEGIGYGENPENVKNAIQKLVYQEEISILTGILGHNGLEDICEFADTLDQTLIFSNIGASTPIDLSRWTNVFCNSFQLNASVFLLGKVLAERGIEKLSTSSSYNDAGYSFTKILETAIHKFKTTEFSGHFITPLYPRENEAQLMTDFIRETEPNALFCSYNGVYAKEHASFLKENKLTASNIPMFMTPFSIGNEVLKAYPEIFSGVQCISTWFATLENEANTSFLKLYQEKYGTEASIFSVLGFENGLLINEQLKTNGQEPIETVGPRGLLYFDKETSRTVFDHYLWSLTYENNEYRFSQERKLDNDHTFLKIEPVVGGWYNTYLCY